MTSGPVLLSRRLVLAPLTHDALSALHALLVDPEVRRHLLDGRIVDESWTRWTLTESQERFLREGVGLWGLSSREGDRKLLGFAGVHYFDRHAQVELVYALAPAHWGSGLATEAARAVLGYAFDHAGLGCARASVDGENRASVRILEKLGMRLVGSYRGGTGDVLCYELSHSAFDDDPPPYEIARAD